ncbi:PREDICTED: DNA polymerase epsilon subunit B-like isoform X2 [Camelina sativa]|uniref:DNA polymerase epsilon subunit n=1 Tax=Camelina sativa TaxID=90675 RepID=A0ABM0XZL4_CAMSA|nr:PREDICTED: DNA polymerase epsilon subunit B-like isoform X1 [Camelina sativa]XP_019097976.1 PREDICTED: DNA polymerase epsilon subunit B-like isoform X2 [Camelina sativa]
MSSTSQKRKLIQKKFKNRSYKLKVDALDEILVFADQFPDDADGEAIDLLLDNLQESHESSTVDAESVRGLINRLLGAHNAPEEPTTSASSLAVIDAFLVPKFGYDAVKKMFNEHTKSLPIHGEAYAKTALYRERFMLLSQRVSRAEHFTRPAFDAEMSQFENNEISSIQSLISQRGRKWVMGVISQLEDGHFYLEDLSASVEIDLSKAKITTGFFTENTIILAEGEMQVNGIFQVITCGFPPLEDRDKTLKTHSECDFFGGGTHTKEETIRLADLERQAVDDTYVILSDIWLDDEEVIGKLKTVLDGFERVKTVPSLFVFMGNFCSRPCNLTFGSYSSLREQFGKLGRMIENHPKLKENSRFLFIPGPDDAGPSTVLPRCALPNYLTEELRNIIPNAIFSSNPCRVKFYNQEIVFFRQDLLYRMRRSCLVTPSSEETEDPFKHLVYTITHQSHLCPLPLMVQPIIWNYDHSLRLYPTPYTIVLGDKSEQAVCRFGGTTCFNPGSFSTDSTFVAYRPSNQKVERSAL